MFIDFLDLTSSFTYIFTSQYYFSGMKEKYTGDMTTVGEEFLEKIGVSPKPSVLKSASIIGQGYNLLTDRTMPSQIFENDLVEHDGIIIPKASLYESVNETKEFMEYFEESMSAVQYRMKKLNIGLGVDFKLFSFESRTGITVGNSSSSQSTNKEFSFLMETRNFKLKLGNYQWKGTLTLNPE